MRMRKVLPVLMVLYGAASLFHFAHNAILTEMTAAAILLIYVAYSAVLRSASGHR